MIDVNVSLFRWPTRRLPLDEPAQLATYLRQEGVTQAWAGSYEAMLHPDLAGVNLRLADACARHGDGLLAPVGAINPQQPDWEEDLRRCVELHQMRVIRLYPNYHGYDLQSPAFARLLELTAARRLIVQIVVRSEDPRTQHRMLQVPDVNPRPLIEWASKWRDLRIVLLNAQPACNAELQSSLVKAGQVYFDIAMQEGAEGLTRLQKSVPPDRILFGSHAPFYAWRSAALKLTESDLPQPFRDQIQRENAARLWQAAGQ